MNINDYFYTIWYPSIYDPLYKRSYEILINNSLSIEILNKILKNLRSNENLMFVKKANKSVLAFGLNPLRDEWMISDIRSTLYQYSGKDSEGLVRKINDILLNY